VHWIDCDRAGRSPLDERDAGGQGYGAAAAAALLLLLHRVCAGFLSLPAHTCNTTINFTTIKHTSQEQQLQLIRERNAVAAELVR